MSTGTAGPFEHIKRPICGEAAEISQSTFVELISIKEVYTRAIYRDNPNVCVALRRLAFGKTPRELPEPPPERGFEILPAPPLPRNTIPIPVGGNNTPVPTPTPGGGSVPGGPIFTSQSAEEKIAGLGIAKASVEFRDLIINNESFATTQMSNCAMIAGDNAPPITPANCPESDCNVDAAFSIDISGSMQSAIDAVKIGAAEMADLISSVSNGSYRFGLSHFGQSDNGGNLLVPLPLTDQQCQNINLFQANVDNLTVSGGHEPWHQVLTYVQDNKDTEWTFRDNSDARIVFVITDEASDVKADEALAAAIEMGRCGVRWVGIWTETRHPNTLTSTGSMQSQGASTYGEFFDMLAAASNGLWVHSPNGIDMLPLMTSFILSVCGSVVREIPECPGGEDKVTNGKFETSIAGWNDETTGAGSVDWDETTESMKLSGIASQEIAGLAPGDIAIMGFGIHLESATVGGILEYRLESGSGDILESAQILSSDLGVGQDNVIRFDLQTTIQLDGAIKIVFDSEVGSITDFYVDNVLLCVLKEDDCGPGSRNLIQNPNFDEGIIAWNDSSNTPITPHTDPEVWDSLTQSIIVSLTGEPEVRTDVTDLRPGENYSLNFELSSFEPEVIEELEFIYGILDASNNVIIENTITRGDADPPQRLQVDFIAPADGFCRVFFKGGTTSGVVKLRNILLCDTSGDCEEGFDKVSFDDFETTRGAWAGGRHDLLEKYIILESAGGDDKLQQTFTSLEPGTTLQVSFSSLNVGSNNLLIELHSGGVINQDSITSAGSYVYTIVVQDTGIVSVIVQNLDTAESAVDNILVCSQASPDCDGSITDVELMVEWDGIPRSPVNIFNAIARYTIRNPNDPFDLTTETHIANTEGVLGLSSCDTWKQEGQGGNPQANVLAFGLNNAAAAAVNEGDEANVSSRGNWIWSIPNSGSMQDVLNVSFPAPPAGLIESVEFFLLTQQATPSGSGTSPILPPPLSCSPDPAQDLQITIRYKNNRSLQREFTQKIGLNELLIQSTDFTSGSPWDTISGVGNGKKGSTARWESFIFELDAADGSGLDQCTPPLFFSASGQGTLEFPDFSLTNSRGIFVDSCLAEIDVTNIAAGENTNEVQIVVLPSPTGGFWNLSFDFGTVETTPNIPWNATALQVRNRLVTLSNINTVNNIEVSGAGSPTDPYLVTFKGALGSQDHNLLIADGSNLAGSASAIIATTNDGSVNERQIIETTTSTIQNLEITFNGETTIPLPFNRSLKNAQTALEGLSTIGVGNVLVTGDTTDRESSYSGRLIVDFIGSLGGQNVSLMTVEPSANYSNSLAWQGGFAPGGGINERQQITVEAFGGSYVLRVFDVGGTVPAVDIGTTTDGNTSNVDCYDITFGGTLEGQNIDLNTFFSPDSGPAPFSHSQQNIQNGEAGTNPIPEIQRHCFTWLLGDGGIGTDDSLFGLESPSDPIFIDILDTVGPTPLVKGIDSSVAIAAYLESALAVPANSITVVASSLSNAVNEVQTATVTGAPIGGTFALVVEGQETVPISFSAPAIDVQNAINSLSNVSDVAVAKSGTLPADVIYTITFQGEDGGKNWQTIVGKADNLANGSAFADTAPIPYNASAQMVKDALVGAAIWLSDSDLDITRDSDTDNIYKWTIEWAGNYLRENIPQMQISGAQLAGGDIFVSENLKGTGSNDQQRLRIVNATGGSFTLSLTIDGVTDETTSIPWNTTAEGLKAQLLQLSFFDAPGQLDVVDEYPDRLPPSPINASFVIIFQKRFGDIPLLVPTFQESLLCDPIVLPHVDPGPYGYPVPIDDNEESCQSGFQLQRPAESEGAIEEIESCCDSGSISDTANQSSRLQLERDLFDPNRKAGDRLLTVRDLAKLKGLQINNYVPYIRDFITNDLAPVSWHTIVKPKDSFILIEGHLTTRRGRERISNYLSSNREILPSRFVWNSMSNNL